MQPEDFKGFTLFESTVKIYDTKELIIAYERNSKEFDEKYDQKFTYGEKFALHFEGIDYWQETHPYGSKEQNCGKEII